MTIHQPLVSSAVFAGGIECNPPGVGRRGLGRGGGARRVASENAAALWIPMEVRARGAGGGLEKGCGPEWTLGPLGCSHSQSKGPRAALPKCSEMGEEGSASGWLMQERGGHGGWGWSSSLHVQPARTDRTGLQCAAPTETGLETGVSVHSLRTCLSSSHHPTPIHFYCSLSCPTPHADPFTHTPRPSPPHPGSATAPGVELLCGSHSPRTDWREGVRL